jgi:PmbA protein
MDFKKLGEAIVKKAGKWGADEAEVYIEKEKNFDVTVRKGDVETLEKAVSKGLALRVFIKKRAGFSYTSDFSPRSLDETIRKTIELAAVTEAKPWQGLPDFGPRPVPGLDLCDPDAAGIPDEKKIALAREVEKIALGLDGRITNSHGGTFSDSEREVGLFSSKGIACEARLTSFSIAVGVIAGEGEDMHRGGWSSSKRFFKELAPAEAVAKIAVREAVEQLGPKPVETKKVPVIFDRYAAPAFWRGILRSMDGDSAFRKTTFMSELLGKAIASPAVTLVDNPTIPRFLSSLPFDGEGRVTTKNVIVEKGVLKMFLYDSQTARKAGVKVNTMTRRSGFRSRPFASALCLTVENGSHDFDSLMRDVKEGFYVKGLRGAGTDRTTGNFSVGASGFWIVDGARAFPVDGLTLGGSALEILKNIDRMANDLDMRGGVNSPSFRVSEMTVGGKRA